ncbi:PAS domain-containing protein [Hyunsoonleella ulvae]|uniref:PAS domain-containing protein n=1 Tax=Hyunsoonleella ulvae TaxID=2799948 RepID=UPI00193A6BFA|nr:PAS domain-containing protein [Hyunsoonleella ulvae]
MKHNLSKMMCLDVYLSSLSKEEYIKVSSKISNSSRIITPLMSWDIYGQDYFNGLNDARRLQDIKKVKAFAIEMNWENNIDSIFENEIYEAIIITDSNQKIVWVNKGFSNMTGYSKVEVLNKTPRILQGDNSSSISRRSIKQKLQGNLPFKEGITNYKKDGNPYECEVKIFPLYHHDTTKTHFIALERQVG